MEVINKSKEASLEENQIIKEIRSTIKRQKDNLLELMNQYIIHYSLLYDVMLINLVEKYKNVIEKKKENDVLPYINQQLELMNQKDEIIHEELQVSLKKIKGDIQSCNPDIFNNSNSFSSINNKSCEEEKDSNIQSNDNDSNNIIQPKVIKKLIPFYSITSDAELDDHLQILKIDSDAIIELEFIDLNQPLLYFLDTSISFYSLEKIKFVSCEINDNDMSNNLIKEMQRFPNLKEIHFNKQIINAKSLQVIPPFLTNNSLPPIQVLKIEKSNLITSEFNQIVKNILLSSQIKESIKILSFANNDITRIDWRKSIYDHDDDDDVVIESFPNLEEFNLMKNKIYQFRFHYDKFPMIKLVNLINNTIISLNDIDLPLQKNNNILVLCNKNMFLTIKASLDYYNERLVKVLSLYDYSIQYMCLSNCFNKSNQSYILQLDLNKIGFSNLKELDLSNCGLTTRTVISFFTFNNHIIQLTTLNLNGNLIEMDFFQSYLAMVNSDEEDSVAFMSNVQSIDLSSNLIDDENFNYMCEFIQINPSLLTIKIQMNPFGFNYSAELIPYPKDNNDINTLIRNDSNLKHDEFMDFCDFVKEIQMNKRKIAIDFSTETRIITGSTLEKKKLTFKVKRKNKKDNSTNM